MFRRYPAGMSAFGVHGSIHHELDDGRYRIRLQMIEPVTSPEHRRWAGLAENIATPEEILLLLATSDVPVVLLTLAERRHHSPAMVESLAAHWRRTGVAALLMPAADELPEPLLRELAAAPDPWARAVAAASAALPADLLPVLLNDPEPRPRIVCTGRDDLTPAQLEQLARDPDPEVREFVGYLRDLPANVVRLLAGDPEPGVRVQVADRAEPHWSPANDPQPEVCDVIAERRPLPTAEPVVPKDGYFDRVELARDPGTAPGVLTGLALGDHELNVVQEACANESLPVPTMWTLVEPLRPRD